MTINYSFMSKSGGFIGDIVAREGSRPTMAKFVIPLRATDQDPYPDMAIVCQLMYYHHLIITIEN
jgi:hypothetical protein